MSAAPLYDLISWLPYSTDARQDRMAMSVDGYYPFARILPGTGKMKPANLAMARPAPLHMFAISLHVCQERAAV
jgi:hypothetical protein